MKFKALLPATALLLVTILAYLPSTGNGFIWDDDSYVYMNQTLDSPKALSQIWFKPSASPQFYPLVFTGFWIEKQLWGLNPAGYHWTNVLLHATAAILLWRILRRLELPGAFAAAAVFALHPIHVESVGWITERKNVLSGFFYLGSLLAYLRFARVDCVLILPPTLSDATKNRRKSNQPSSAARLLRKAFSPGGWGWYGFAFLLFCAALLSKTVTCSLPAVVLLLLWWKHERMTARNVSALVPFFLLGLAMGLMTATLEKQQVGAEGDE